MTENDFHQMLVEKLASRLEEKEHESLLKEILEWYEEGGSKQVETRLRDRIDLLLHGVSTDVE